MFPAPRIEGINSRAGALPGSAKAGPQAQLPRARWPGRCTRADFTQFQPLGDDVLPRPFCCTGTRTRRLPSLKALAGLRGCGFAPAPKSGCPLFDRSLGPPRGTRRSHATGRPTAAPGEEQPGQQFQRQRPFRLAAAAGKRAASGLCRPSSSNTPVVILAKAAQPRRLLALRAVAVTWGVLVRLNCVPSSATNRQPRQGGPSARWRPGPAGASPDASAR